MPLIALALRDTKGKPRRERAIILAGPLGAGMFYGDHMVTSAISVLSALEGFDIATPPFDPSLFH